MEEKKPYGELSSEQFELGDIVEWTKWNPHSEVWESYYGVIVKICSKIVSNRLVSISTVLPIESGKQEQEFFSLSLKLVSRAPTNEIFSGSYSNFS